MLSWQAGIQKVHLTHAGFTKRFPKAKRFTDPRSLLEDPKIQVILTSAIPSERAKISITAMNHGKDVMSDKPGCVSFGDLQELRQTVLKTGRSGQWIFPSDLKFLQ